MCEIKTKVCKGECGLEKNLDEFTKNSGYKDGLCPKCKSCYSDEYYKKQGRVKVDKPIPKEGCKFCSKCKEEKDYSEFCKSPDTSIGLSSKCKTCANIDNERNRDKPKLKIEDKVCRRCESVLPITDYHKNKGTIDGYHLYCKKCCKDIKDEIRIEVESKTCFTCKIEKPSNYFHNDSSKRDGLNSNCKECVEKIWQRDADKIKERYEKSLIKNREASCKRENERRANNPVYKLSTNIKSLIRGSFKRACSGEYTKGERTETILGCTMAEFLEHITSQFTEGMTLFNHGMCKECWHLDHKQPISTAQTEEEIYTLNHYTNLRPLWSTENLQKGSKSVEEFEAWLKR